MDKENSLKNKLTLQAFLVTGIAILAGAIGITGITSFPAGFGALAIIFVAPFYFIAAIAGTVGTIKTDRKYLNELSEEQKNILLKNEAAQYNTNSQHATFGATAALTLILPAALILLTLMILSPDANTMEDKYTPAIMVIGTMLVIASAWLGFANHLNIFNKTRRTTQKLVIRERATNWKLIRTSRAWTTTIWVIGGLLSVAAFIGMIFDGGI